MVEITIRLNRELNYKNRSTNTTFFICLVSGAIGSANALCLFVKVKRNEVKLSHYFSD